MNYEPLRSHLSAGHRELLAALMERHQDAYGGDLLGVVLSGSAGRGLATERSDLDVYVVVADRTGQETTVSHSAAVDEVVMTISELERVPPFGSGGWWFRWSFAWAPVLLDRTGGRLPAALVRLATVTDDEAAAVLVEHDRLDGWLNLAYRALNDRDGRPLECRLDAAESLPWLLDVIFSLAGRVRPYNKYLPWELRHHPLPDWDADELLGLLDATLAGDPAAIRATFERIVPRCAAFDRERPAPLLMPLIESWGRDVF